MRTFAWALVAGWLVLPLSTMAAADDPCAAFTWDVHHERELFAAAPQSVAATAKLAAAPALAGEHLYALQLLPQAQVSFVVAPGKHRSTDGPYAGLARVTVPQAGSYRISLDAPLWIDVLANGGALAARDFQGRPGCSAPHKIVEFELPAHTPLTLQFSGAQSATVKLALTRSPGP
jgi:hypothetical protein